MSATRLLRYAPYQLQQYVVERGLVTLLLAAMLVGPQLWMLRTMGQAMDRRYDVVAAAAFRDIATILGAVAVLFAINGISSLDRQRGYFRFLFAKPVSVPAYYAQEYVVRGVGTLAAAALVSVVFALVARVPVPWGFVGYVGIVYVLLGGVGFLLSALVQFDGLLLTLVWLASFMLLSIRRAAPERVPLAVARLLPPVDRFDAARDALLGGGALPAADLWQMLGYGVGCVVAGLLVLRRRPLST